MGFPVVASAAAGIVAGGVGMGVAYAWQHGYAEAVGRLDGSQHDVDRVLHYHDPGARLALLGVQGIGGCIAWTGVQVDAPGAIVFGIGMMAAAAGAQLGWWLAERTPQ